MPLSLVWLFANPRTIYSPWNSPGQNTGVGSLSLLQGILPTQGSNPSLWHCRQILYQLSHKGSPRILEWVAYPFSSGSSQPRNRTGVSCIAGGFFTNWATREAHMLIVALLIMQKTLDTTWMSNYRWIWKENFNHTVISLLWNYNHEKWCQIAAFSNVNVCKNILGILLKWIFWFNRFGGDT